MHPKCIRNASEMYSKFRLAIGHFSSESLSIDSTPNWSETPIWNWMSTLHRIATFGFLVSLVSFKLVGDCNFHFQIQSISFAINQNWAFKLDIFKSSLLGFWFHWFRSNWLEIATFIYKFNRFRSQSTKIGHFQNITLRFLVLPISKFSRFYLTNILSDSVQNLTKIEHF